MSDKSKRIYLTFSEHIMVSHHTEYYDIAASVFSGTDVTESRACASTSSVARPVHRSLEHTRICTSFVSKMDSNPDGREYGSRAKRIKLDVGEAISFVESHEVLRRSVSGAVDANFDGPEGKFSENMLLFRERPTRTTWRWERNGGHFVGVVLAPKFIVEFGCPSCVMFVDGYRNFIFFEINKFESILFVFVFIVIGRLLHNETQSKRLIFMPRILRNRRRQQVFILTCVK